MLPLNTKACPVTDMQILRWWILAECLQQCALRLQRIEKLFFLAFFFSPFLFFNRQTTLILSRVITLEARKTARERERERGRQTDRQKEEEDEGQVYAWNPDGVPGRRRLTVTIARPTCHTSRHLLCTLNRHKQCAQDS